MDLVRWCVGWLAAIAIVILRATCRVRRYNDPRPVLRTTSKRYLYSVLHAHQVCGVIDGEAGTGAMVSRSGDGGLIVPSLRVRGIVPIRGSSSVKGKDKGGTLAFQALVAHVEGGRPAYLAVDGPRGPRNQVQKGIALLAQQTGAPVLNLVAIPTRRWILAKAWDRMQIPKPFSTIHVYFSEPLRPQAGEAVEDFRQRIENDLTALERRHDPEEFVEGRRAARH